MLQQLRLGNTLARQSKCHEVFLPRKSLLQLDFFKNRPRFFFLSGLWIENSQFSLAWKWRNIGSTFTVIERLSEINQWLLFLVRQRWCHCRWLRESVWWNIWKYEWHGCWSQEFLRWVFATMGKCGVATNEWWVNSNSCLHPHHQADEGHLDFFRLIFCCVPKIILQLESQGFCQNGGSSKPTPWCDTFIWPTNDI